MLANSDFKSSDIYVIAKRCVVRRSVVAVPYGKAFSKSFL